MTLRMKWKKSQIGWLLLFACVLALGSIPAQAQECVVELTCIPLDTIYCTEEPDTSITGVPGVEATCLPYVLSYSDVTLPGQCPQNSVVIRTWVVTDAQQNADTCVQVIEVRDYERPVLACGDTVVVACPADIPAVGEGVEVTDNCDPDPELTLEDADTTGTCPTIINRYYTAYDACGNGAKCTQTIVVSDTTAPVLSSLPMDTISCEAPLVWTVPTAEDNCAGDVDVFVLSTDTTSGPGAGEISYTRCWTAEDLCGSADTTCQTIVRLACDEFLPPVIKCPPRDTIACEATLVWSTPVADAECPGPIDISVLSTDTVSGPGEGEFSYTRCWVAEDSCGLADTCCQTIVRLDCGQPTPPVIKCPPSDTIECEAVLTWVTPAVDGGCGGDVDIDVISTDTVAGPGEGEFTYTRCWEAVDTCGLTDTCCQTIVRLECEMPPDSNVACTFTQGGWGNTCPRPQVGDLTSTQPGCIRDNFFDEVFPNGVVIGDPSGFTATFTSAEAVQEYLPTGGKAAALTEDVVDPAQKSLNVLVSQVLALTLNAGYSCEGVFAELGLTGEDACLGDYVIGENCGGEEFEGLTVNEFLAIANLAISGDEGVLEEFETSYSSINDVASCLNESLHCGDGDDEGEEDGEEDGEGSESSNEEKHEKKFALKQNRPNPFNPSTTISLSLPVASNWTLTIYNVTGQKVAEFSGYHEAGELQVTWDATNQASGVYLYRAAAGGFSETRKMLLLK